MVTTLTAPISNGARAETGPAVSPTLAPGAWNVDKAHSRVEFSVRHLMITDVRGRFAAFDARLVVGERPEDSSVFVSIEAPSIDTGNAMRDGHLKSADFFDAGNHPSIVFQSDRVTPTDASSWQVNGQMTMKGQTHPLALTATLGGISTDPRGNCKAGLSIRGELEREQWGVTFNQPLETGGVMIGSNVRIEIELQITPAAALSLVEGVHALEGMIESHEAALERDRTLPPVIVAALKQAGVFRCFVPKSLGGLEVHPIEWLEMVEELSRINGSVGWLAMINGGTGFAGLEPSVARAIFSETPGAISAGNATPGGTTKKVTGGYVANGRWKFTSGCMHADYIGGFCVLLDDDGKPFPAENGRPAGRNMFFKRSEIEIVDTWDGMGMRGTGSHDMVAKDVFVPDERATHREFGEPNKYHDGPLYKHPFLLLGHAGHALGIARAALEAAVETEARGFGALAVMMGREGAQVAMAEAEAIVQAARCFVWDAVARGYEEARAGAVSREAAMRMQLAMIHSVHEAARAVDLVYHQAGSRSVYTSNALSRCFRDIHTATQHIIIFKPNYKAVGNYYFGKAAKGT